MTEEGVIVQEAAGLGPIRLAKSEMDVLRGTDGRWHGKNAEALELALSNLDGFTWPKRLKNIILSEGEIMFSVSSSHHDQTSVPTVLAFRIVAPVGARLTADYLHEFE